MKIPPLNALGRVVVPNLKAPIQKPPFESIKKDTISFSASTAYYLKKYNTLPSEIKKILKPKDAIDMFKNMEMIQKGIQQGRKIGQGNYSQVYENPWLEDYCYLFSQKPKMTTQVIYSRYELGDAIWSDKDNQVIQLIARPQGA